MQSTDAILQRWTLRDSLLLAFVAAIVLILAFLVFSGVGLSVFLPSTPAHRPSGVDYGAESSAILSERDVCHDLDTPIVRQTILIATNPHALIPDVIDIHYTCGIDGPQQAVLWEPGSEVNGDDDER